MKGHDHPITCGPIRTQWPIEASQLEIEEAAGTLVSLIRAAPDAPHGALDESIRERCQQLMTATRELVETGLLAATTAPEVRSMEEVTFRIAWADGVLVHGQIIDPPEWRLAAHRYPSFWLDEDPCGWAVSDVVTGRLVAIADEREMAISGARGRLKAEAFTRNLCVETLLDTLREKIQHERRSA
ncbi:hypothetical protein MARPU_09625 [Marichromatium purpuratum 984]|uniref:Uncharacterized protein n=1 Tax=Marichromatium purpuratum 984 TaxID=765910 RepID=W0E7L6_MARPU|nr:hypothetical protein [Marichromatium purpuratum]AHF05518.1 hypothetical protein MARPU_09625 [Marichromatium purpuratum 984]